MEMHLHYQYLFWASFTALTLLWGMQAAFPIPALAAEPPATETVPSSSHADQDSVAFADPNLEALVAKAFSTGGRPVTYGDIRHYRGVQPDISDYTNSLVATSLEGLESLRELPAGIGIAIQFDVAKRVSWAPLAGVPVSGSLTVFQDGMHNTDFTALNQVNILEDPSTFPRQLCLTGIHGYTNYAGLTDADVHLLDPLLSKFSGLKYHNQDGRTNLTISNQRVTDFSYFRKFGKVNVLGIGQYVDFKQKVTYIDPATFTPDTTVRLPARVKGLDGEPVQNSLKVFNNVSKTLTLDGTDALVSGIYPKTKWLIIMPKHTYANYSEAAPIDYPDGSILLTDSLQYYRLKWAKAPVPAKPSPKPGFAPKSPVNPISTAHANTASHPQPPRKEAAAKQHPQHFQPRVVYAIKSLYLYRHATFRVKERQARYAQQPRANRPLFIIIGEAKSHAGRRRYRVRDINHESRTDGQTGYITASTGYVTAAYYRTAPSQITVIDPAGVDAHSQPHLTTANPVTHYAQGSVLKVIAIQHRHLTTRLQLTNGTYITANRQLIRAGKLVSPTHIQTQTRVTRYGTANLTERRQTYRPGRRLRVLGWAYAHPHDLSKPSPRRYRIPGGYVTANPRVVRVID